jgi:hypothetical protein
VGAEAHSMPGTDLSAGNTMMSSKSDQSSRFSRDCTNFKTKSPATWQTLQSLANQDNWSPKMSYKIAPISQYDKCHASYINGVSKIY